MDTPTPDQTNLFGLSKPSSLKQLSLKIKFFLGSLFYLTYAPQAYLYSYRRDRLERQLMPPAPVEADTPGKLLQAEPTSSGAHFYFERAELEVDFLATDFVRLNWQPGLAPIPYGIAQPERTVSAVDAEVDLTETPEGWVVSSGELQVVVGVEGSINFYEAGRLLRQELPPQRKGEAWSHQAQLRPEENIYGLGERAAPLNLRSLQVKPKKGEEASADAVPHPAYRMWNYDAAGMYGTGSDPMYVCIPVYLSLHQQGSYLIFYENTFEATFTLAKALTAAFEGGALRYYVATGSPAQVLERYTQLTGRAPLPPRWALGYHQSRWGYRTEAAVRETVQTFRSLNLPLSAIHLDIDVQVGYRAFTLDPDRFPELGNFTQELAEQGVQFITILNPGIKYSRKSKLFLEGRMLEAFCKLPNGELVTAPVWCGWSVFPDFTNPRVRQWWSRQYEFLLDLGVAGFWHDMNEPAAFIAWGDRSLPKPTRHYMEGRGGDHREAHNVYGLLQAQAGYESLCQYRPEQRPFIVSRAGWAGLQRYAWTWTGDVECTWEALHQTIPTVLGLGLSGVPYSGPDIGGFQGNPSAELYLRWFQLATFLPFYRSHCSNNVEYRAPWTYGEPYLSIIRSLLQLRYRLMPYFYTLAWEASQTGHPLVRPLFWYHTDQPELWGIDDAFYLGAALLVCPVLQEGARSRLVSLPKGHWHSLWDNTRFQGGQEIELEAPLEEIPLLVKAGSILPMVENEQLILQIYPPTELENSEANNQVHENHVYSDAGDGYGEWRLDQLRLIRFSDGLELFWQQQGDYPHSPEGIQLNLHSFKLQQVWIDGVETALQNETANDDRSAHHQVSSPFKQAFFKGEFL